MELDTLGTKKNYLTKSSYPSGIIRSALRVLGFFSALGILIDFPVISQCFQAGNPIIPGGTGAIVGRCVSSVRLVGYSPRALQLPSSPKTDTPIPFPFLPLLSFTDRTLSMHFNPNEMGVKQTTLIDLQRELGDASITGR